MNNQLETFCRALKNDIDRLCEHNATRNEVYEDIKDEVRKMIACAKVGL